MFNYSTIFDVPDEDILEYIKSYYNILYYFFKFDMMTSKEIIESLLLLDTYYNESNQFTYSFWNTLLLLGVLRSIEKDLDNYKNNLALLDKDIFLEMVKKKFDFYLLNCQKQFSTISLEEDILLQTVNDNCINIKDSWNNIKKKEQFPIFNNADFLHYSNLSIEKNQYKEDNCIKVAILGEVSSLVIENIYEHLQSKNTTNRILLFKIFSSSQMIFSEKYDNVISIDSESQVLKSPSLLDKIVTETDFIIIFDSYDLYNADRIEKSATEEVDFIFNSLALLK